MSRLLVAALLLATSGSLLDRLPPADGAGARAFLVRHAQALSNLDPPPEGLSGEELDHLTDLGRQQAALAAAELRDQAVELVLSSPASRARETAQIIAEALGVPVRVEPRLQPLAVGDGLEWDDRFAEWKAGRDSSPPGGESMAQVGERVYVLVESLPSQVSGGGGAVLVAHAEVIGAYLGHLLSVSPHRRLEDPVGNGSISVVDTVPGGPPSIAARDLHPGGEASPD